MKCDKCGYDDNGSGDTAHVCGKVTIKTMPLDMDKLKQLYQDPRHEILSEMSKLLDSSRMWGGMGWNYSPIHPVKYLPLRDKVKAEIDKLAKEYGL